MEVKRRLLVAHPAERMYDLIEAAEHYPAFLPWCRHATVLERTESVVEAQIGVDWHGVRFEFRTRNPKRRPEWLGVRLAEGPFREFEGEWRLVPLGSDGCRIEFLFRYDFENPLLRRVAGHVFERITNTMVDAFVARADRLGGAIPVPALVPGPRAPVPVMRATTSTDAATSPIARETPPASPEQNAPISPSPPGTAGASPEPTAIERRSPSDAATSPQPTAASEPRSGRGSDPGPPPPQDPSSGL